MLKSPCKGCKERYKNCHSHCEDYIDFQREISDVKQKQQEDYNMKDYEIQRSLKINRRRGKKKW